MSDIKLKELVLYIADKCKGDRSFGATKLNKMLYLVDMNYYAWRGKSVTGAKYRHLPNGPVSAKINNAINALKKEKRAQVKKEDYFGYTINKILPLMGADASLFKEEEMELVEAVIEQTRPKSASDLSEWTHSLNPWLVTTNGEEIPYHSIFVLKQLPVEADGISWAKKRLKELKKLQNAA